MSTSVYDALDNDDDYRELNPSKRTKFGRRSGEWRFSERSPSPVQTTETAMDQDQGSPSKDIAQQPSINEPTVANSNLEPSRPSVPREKEMDSDIPVEDNIVTGVEVAGSAEALEGGSIGSLVQDGTTSDRSSQTRSPPAPQAELDASEPGALVQDTYDRELWSSPSTTADPSMEVATGILYGGKHGAPDTPYSSDALQLSSPPQVSLSPHQSSRLGSAEVGSNGEDEEDVSLQGDQVDLEGLDEEEYGEEPFSRRAYMPSESVGSSDMASEDLGIIEAGPDASVERQQRNRPIYEPQDAYPSQDIPSPSDSQGIDYGYDGSMFSRPRDSPNSTPKPADQANTQTASTAVHAVDSSAHVLDSSKGTELESSVLPEEEVVPEVIVKYAHSENEVARALSRSEYKAQELSGQTRDISPGAEEHEGAATIGKEADAGKGSQVLQGTYSGRELINKTFEKAVEQPSIGKHGILPGDQSLSRPEHEALDRNESVSGGDEDGDSASEATAYVRRVDVARSVNEQLVEVEKGLEVVSDEEYFDEEYPEETRSVHTGESLSDAVEIIDLDEYESERSEEEEGEEDLGASESGDYWSDEEILGEAEARVESDNDEDNLDKEGPENDFEDDDELMEEEDFGSAEAELEDEMDDEEATLYEHTSLAHNVLQESGVGHKSRLEARTSTVEIIDLESEDDEEPATGIDVAHARPMSGSDPTPAYLLAKEAVLFYDLEDDSGINKAVPRDRSEQPEADIDLGVQEHVEPSLELPRDIGRVVHDTYSESAALSDTEASETSLAKGENAEADSLHWRMEYLPDPADAAVEPAASPSQKSVPDEGGILAEDSQGLAETDGIESTIHSSPHNEEIVICERKDSVGHVQLPVQVLPGFPPNEEPPVSPSATADMQTETSMSARDQVFEALDPAKDALISPDQEISQTYEDGFNEEVARDYSLQDLRDKLIQRSQLPTPNDTQTSKIIREPSDLTSISHDEQNTLLTPCLTQGTSELLTPATPALPRKPSLIEKLKEMRSNSARKRQASLGNDVPVAVSPWFGTSRSSQIAPSSDRESVVGVGEETGRDGDVSSEVEHSEADKEPALPRRRAASPALEPGIARLPSSSPPSLPEPKAGFRTSLSYFAPLSTLRSHYNATTSVLALVIASTPVSRATAGPKDYHMTIHITDPSSASPPSVTSARIFRPSKLPFPEAQQGDAILLRNFRVVSYRKHLGLLSTGSSAWAVFRRGEEPQIRGPPVEFGAEERGFARGHWDWWGTVERQKYIDAVPHAVGRPARDSKRGKGRSSLVRHELRDGTTYFDTPKGEDNNDMHELRDGTVWSDSKL